MSFNYASGVSSSKSPAILAATFVMQKRFLTLENGHRVWSSNHQLEEIITVRDLMDDEDRIWEWIQRSLVELDREHQSLLCSPPKAFDQPSPDALSGSNWESPPTNCWKINVDAAKSIDESIRIGVVIRVTKRVEPAGLVRCTRQICTAAPPSQQVLAKQGRPIR
ncbi:hypothetical protein PIB30_085391 [Stylosanthes scabra]|uniref:Uncharacterized protein n=1 Tax=Stylosanthes scabra TaxID=79078 RepID=A0ABU6VT57_9FABA|nr:hypothetical protein [Stylosanthes scabra]